MMRIYIYIIFYNLIILLLYIYIYIYYIYYIYIYIYLIYICIYEIIIRNLCARFIIIHQVSGMCDASILARAEICGIKMMNMSVVIVMMIMPRMVEVLV